MPVDVERPPDRFHAFQMLRLHPFLSQTPHLSHENRQRRMNPGLLAGLSKKGPGSQRQEARGKDAIHFEYRPSQ
jgi:hypothetical protein